MNLNCASWAFVISGFLFSSSLWATPIVTWEYSFVTTNSFGTQPINHALEGVLVEGQFQYQVDIQGRTGSGGYQHQLLSSSVSVNGTPLLTGATNLSGNTANRVRIFNDLASGPPDIVSLSQTVNQVFGGFTLEAVGLLILGDEDTLSSYDLVPDLFELSDHIQGRLFFTDTGEPEWYAYGNVDIRRVPEPSILALLGTGLIGLGIARKSKLQLSP